MDFYIHKAKILAHMKIQNTICRIFAILSNIKDSKYESISNGTSLISDQLMTLYKVSTFGNLHQPLCLKKFKHFSIVIKADFLFILKHAC